MTPRIRTLPVLLAIILWAPVCLGGPNAGGTLIVHDTGLWYTAGGTSAPTVPPEDCAVVDAELPVELDPSGQGRIWKVYAAFTPGSEPRLKALAFSTIFDAAQVRVITGGLPDSATDFEITQFGWPTASGGAAGISFLHLQTGTMSEVYWFAGYAYTGTGGLWSTAPHPTQASVFVDDAAPPAEDPIVGFSSIGFGLPGTILCPVTEQACCLPDGSCEVMTPYNCNDQGGTFTPGVPCDPNPCQAYEACCATDGGCRMAQPRLCFDQGGASQGPGSDCDPNPCPLWGACCRDDGSCSMTLAGDCLGSDEWFQGVESLCWPNPCPGLMVACCDRYGYCFLYHWFLCDDIGGTPLPGVLSCQPNPCPQTPGACCFPDGSCVPAFEDDCSTGHWLFWSDCDPNPCPQLGACCHPDASCEVLPRHHCHDSWIPGSCDPNPCPTLQGACCLPDGSCEVRLMTDCAHAFHAQAECEPNPCPLLSGACCVPPSYECVMLSLEDCIALNGEIWDVSCDPDPCPASTPVERSTWGKIKARYAE